MPLVLTPCYGVLDDRKSMCENENPENAAAGTVAIAGVTKPATTGEQTERTLQATRRSLLRNLENHFNWYPKLTADNGQGQIVSAKNEVKARNAGIPQ